MASSDPVAEHLLGRASHGGRRLAGGDDDEPSLAGEAVGDAADGQRPVVQAEVARDEARRVGRVQAGGQDVLGGLPQAAAVPARAVGPGAFIAISSRRWRDAAASDQWDWRRSSALSRVSVSKLWSRVSATAGKSSRQQTLLEVGHELACTRGR